MNTPSIVALINNTALLLAMGLLYDITGPGRQGGGSREHQLFNGFTITLISIAAIVNAWEFLPGLMFDSKSVILSISGVFFGPGPTLIAVLGASAFRVYMGGIGLWTGLGSIILSGAIGIAWRRFRLKSNRRPSIRELVFLGAAVHAAMLLWMLTLPWPLSVRVLSITAIPVMLIYPAATALLGRLMLSRETRIQSENALQKSEERFELAMKFANDGLFDWDLETNAIYYSPGWKKILGYRDHEIENRFSEWERLTKPEDVKASWALMNEVLAGDRERFENEFQMRHKDGHWVDILARAKVVFDKTGKAVRVVGTHVDITERKRMEKALRESEARLASFFDHSPVGMLILNTDDPPEYLAVNETLARMNGVPASNHIGGTISDVFDNPRMSEDNNALIKSAIQTKQVKQMEAEGVNPKGDRIHYRVSYFPIFASSTEEVEAVGGVVLDITKGGAWESES